MKTLGLRLTFSAMLALMGILASCDAGVQEPKITVEEARKIGSDIMVSIKGPSIVPTFVQLYHEPQNQCITMLDRYRVFRGYVWRVKAILADRSYYLVMYDPPRPRLGFAICIFVDAMNGKVLHHRVL